MRNILNKNLTLGQIAQFADRRQLIRQIQYPVCPMDTYHALKAVLKHVTQNNLLQSFFLAVKCVHSWNVQGRDDETTGYHEIYVNRMGRPHYTEYSLKRDILTSMESAREIEIFHDANITPMQVHQMNPTQLHRLYLSRYPRKVRRQTESLRYQLKVAGYSRLKKQNIL